MPPNNTNSRKAREALEVGLELEERRPLAKCLSKEETSTRCGRAQANGIGHSKSQTNVKEREREEEQGEGGTCGPQRNRSVCSLVDELLCDIYSKMEVKRRTSATTCDLSWHDSDYSRNPRNESRCLLYWQSKDVRSLRAEKTRLERLIAEEGSNLVKHLKRKNFLLLKREAHYDVITAYIQAVSTKRREDTKMKFSLTPGAETGFSQWLDAMKMVAQLPGGMPAEFRTKLWLQLSEKHLNDQNVDWEKAEAVIFNEFTNPDDEELGVQIVKDLHRTGCSLFCGEQEHNQALLKRVLLAYARWNKNVGYCQGFNMLAALILQVMDKDEKNAVKVMIYLIEGVLPESYFANNLRGLSVDMAVFRDLLRLRLPKLSKHLEALQHDTNAGASYEPPLTNVFTMQWFLTLFSNCLPQQTVLRVWDLVFLYGNEVLLRTALAIWGILQDRVITVESADEFYSIMGVVTREMLEFGLMDANTLVKMIAMVDPFPNELQELREKYLYNISPWTQSVQSAARKGIRLFYSDPDDQDDTEDEDKIALATAYGVFRRRESTSKELQISGPTLDIGVLKQQYAKLRQRQRQAHVIITAACSSNLASNFAPGPSVSVNHLLMGKSALVNKGRRIGPPEGSIPPPSNKKADDREEKRSKVVISGETFHWKDAAKTSKEQKKPQSNKVILENERNRLKAEGETGRTKTNHDRTGGVSEKSVADSLRAKEADAVASCSSSSSSSTSTELCDDEFLRHTDFDSDDASHSDASALAGERTAELSASERVPENSGCDTDNLTEIKNVAIRLVSEIEERVRASGKLGGGKRGDEGEGEGERRKIDNTIVSLLDKDIQISRDNILKPEPEVPRREEGREGVREERDEGEGTQRGRRKSDLGLSVIRENLEMLSKFSQKSSERVQGKSFEEEEAPDGRGTAEEGEAGEETGGREFSLLLSSETRHDKSECEEPIRTSKNFLVERAISPMAEKCPKTVKVNKEVNTELTFGVEEVEISTRQSRLSREEEELPATTSGRRSREALFREKDEIKQRIETSKSDWELKMRRIAELETTTREALNEIQSRSAHRKSLHRSLDRNTRRTHLEAEWKKPSDTSFLPKIRLESSNSTEGESGHRKLKISALSFDEITSRTEKLLGKGELESWKQKNTVENDSSPDLESWKKDFVKNISSEPESWKRITSRQKNLSAEQELWKKKDSAQEKFSPEREFWKQKESAQKNLSPELESWKQKTSSQKNLSPNLEPWNQREFVRRSPSPELKSWKQRDFTSKNLSERFHSREEPSWKQKDSAQMKLSPELESWKQKDSSSKFKELIEDCGAESEETRAKTSAKNYEFFSSPTSPENRTRSNIRFGECLAAKKYSDSKEKFEDDLIRITQNEGRTAVELLDRKHEPEFDSHPSRTSFNPFPTRTASRPKELGVKLGLYPTSPETQSKKS